MPLWPAFDRACKRETGPCGNVARQGGRKGAVVEWVVFFAGCGGGGNGITLKNIAFPKYFPHGNHPVQAGFFSGQKGAKSIVFLQGLTLSGVG